MGWVHIFVPPSSSDPLALGVFAKETIPAGAFIGVYTGELLTEGIVGKRSP